MSVPLLTIVVPTYNRYSSLELLLRSLMYEVGALSNEVEIYVADNASTDSTHTVIQQIRAEWPALVSYRQASNVGPDCNFIHSVNQVRSRWFWIISDDDLPKRGVVAQVLAQLRARKPALLYLQSEWVKQILSPDQGESVGTLRVSDMTALDFAGAVHVWTTFISGMVIDKERLITSLGGHSINRFDATNLAQLGWVLPLLRSEGPFLFISDRCILATKDNTGGYGLLTVFGVNFTRIVNESFGVHHPLARVLIQGNVIKYLPPLIWGTRNPKLKTSHTFENPWADMERELGSLLFYWILLLPLGRFPAWLAKPIYLTWRIADRVRRDWESCLGSKT